MPKVSLVLLSGNSLNLLRKDPQDCELSHLLLRSIPYLACESRSESMSYEWVLVMVNSYFSEEVVPLPLKKTLVHPLIKAIAGTQDLEQFLPNI